MSFSIRVASVVKVASKILGAVQKAKPLVEAFREKSKKGSGVWKLTSTFCVTYDAVASLYKKINDTIDSSLNSFSDSLNEIMSATSEDSGEAAEEPGRVVLRY